MQFQVHIGVLAFPFGTHAAPLLTLVGKLASATPNIKFSFFNSATSNNFIFPAHVSDSFNNIKAYDVWDGTPKGFRGSHFEEIEFFLKVSPDNFEKVIEEAEIETGLKVSCLITDAFLWFACDMAEKRGVPWVAFWTAGSCSLSAHIYTDDIQNSVGSKENETSSKELLSLPGLSKVQIDDLPQEIFLDENSTSLARTIYNMVLKLPKSTAVVLNSFEEIDPEISNDLKSKFQHFLNVGPSILSSPVPFNPNNDQNGCLSWLEKQTRPNSVVYISFGTVIVPPENEIVALADALEACGFPFIWSIKDHAKKFLPEKFLKSSSDIGKIVSRAPQLQVLQHSSIGLFITHCGWNSILETIVGVVPMICRPFFGDQKLNARMVEDSWKIGLRVKEDVFTKTHTIEAIQHVMLSEAGAEMKENLNKLRKQAKEAVELEGSSTKNLNSLLEIICTTK